MKKLWLLSLTVLMAVLTACQVETQPVDTSMLKSGDEIDGMIITTGAARTPPLWAFCSPASENDDVVNTDCRVPQVSELAIGHTFGLANPKLQTLDWSELTWELTLDGQPVDLEAFGAYNFLVPDLAPYPSPIREVFRQVKGWDVVLINPTPGRHLLEGVAYTTGETYYRWSVIFTIEPPF
ncbi:MAG: hypothetical protein U0V48_03040 [Anaerolineales bacterium]